MDLRADHGRRHCRQRRLPGAVRTDPGAAVTVHLVDPHPADRHRYRTAAGDRLLVLLTFGWTNPDTLGPLSIGDKVLAAFTNGSMPRSGGFSSVDFGAMNLETNMVVIVLMFIGGGSAPLVVSSSPRSCCWPTSSGPRSGAARTS
jgi:hypothetical protein